MVARQQEVGEGKLLWIWGCGSKQVAALVNTLAVAE